MTRLVVGLGNPGPDYDGTRHNVGFAVLDHLARHEGLLFRSASKLEGYDGPKAFSFARSFDPAAILLEPETFMNRSGDAVLPVAKWAGIEARDIMVVYDDLDLPLGALRLRSRGGTGGHNGMESIIERLGTDLFPRLRVGIGRPRTDAVRHVLGRFSDEERPEMEISVVQAAEAVFDWLRGDDIETCMTRYHNRWNQGTEA